MKSLEALNLKEKRVLLRVDLNVPLDKGRNILDDFRIQRALGTIEYLRGRRAKIVLISHLGNPQGKVVPSLSLQPVGERLAELLNLEVKMAQDCLGWRVKRMIQKMEPGQVGLLENLRFHKEEEENDSHFAQDLANLGEVFVNDAWGVAHRPHASLAGIPRYLPSAAGLVFKEEIKVLEKILKKPQRPFLVIVGGKKTSKLKMIPELLERADHLLLGGKIGEDILRGKGILLGKPGPGQDLAKIIEKIELTDPKLHLPIDVVVSLDKEAKDYLREAPLGGVRKEEEVLDIGPETLQLFAELIKKAKTIVWTGPLGYFEEERFAQGSKFVAEAILKNKKAFSVVGGRETLLVLKNLGLREKFGFLSTGGGSTLAFLAGEKLPAIEALEK